MEGDSTPTSFTDDGRRRLMRHGHLPEHEISIGLVAVCCPRVRGRRFRAHPLFVRDSASLRAPVEEPGGANPDPLSQGHLDRRLRGRTEHSELVIACAHKAARLTLQSGSGAGHCQPATNENTHLDKREILSESLRMRRFS
jgi:hypothetical protein